MTFEELFHIYTWLESKSFSMCFLKRCFQQASRASYVHQHWINSHYYVGHNVQHGTSCLSAKKACRRITGNSILCSKSEICAQSFFTISSRMPLVWGCFVEEQNTVFDTEVDSQCNVTIDTCHIKTQLTLKVQAHQTTVQTFAHM